MYKSIYSIIFKFIHYNLFFNVHYLFEYIYLRGRGVRGDTYCSGVLHLGESRAQNEFPAWHGSRAVKLAPGVVTPLHDANVL